MINAFEYGLFVNSSRQSRFDRRVTFNLSDRLTHMLILGQTGSGKSTLLSSKLCHDFEVGQAFSLIDPHGDLAAQVIKQSKDKAIYWNLGDEASSIGYNPLAQAAKSLIPLIASNIIETFKRQWEDAWGARMEHLLRYALMALLERDTSTLQDIMPMFLDKDFRERVVADLSDPQVRYFWENEYPAMKYRTSVDGVAPIANKLGSLLAHPLVRKALCTPVKPIHFQELLNRGQCLVVNLARGRIGADVSNVVGGLIVSALAQAAYQRQELPPEQRKPYFLYIDEFQSFTTEAFADMLSSLRKYGLGIIATTQYLSGMSEKVRDAVFGNVGNIVAFRLGAPDASLLVRHFGYDIPSVSDLVNLPNYECYVRMMIDGAQSKPLSARTTPMAHIA